MTVPSRNDMQLAVMRSAALRGVKLRKRAIKFGRVTIFLLVGAGISLVIGGLFLAAGHPVIAAGVTALLMLGAYADATK